VLADPPSLLPGTVVIAAPHMDDEVLACGGTIARLPDKRRVHVVYATDGTRSPGFPWRHGELPELRAIRMAESRQALRVLGVPEVNLHFLDFPEARLERHEREFAVAFGDVMRQLRPDHVLIPFRYDRHPDHLAVNRTAMAGQGQPGTTAQVFEYFVYFRWRLLPGRDVRRYVRPDQLLEVDIADVATAKRKALDCFTSQTTCFYSWQDRPILTQSSLDEVCRRPEFFVKYDPAFPGAGIFASARPWIRFVHAVEPGAKRRKDRVMALIRRGLRHDGRRTP
jgi:LmbE family N-acetylglucosaminyl deacetylase